MPSINVELTEEELLDLKKFKKKGESWKEFIWSSLWFKGCVIREPHTEFDEKWKVDPPIKIEKPCHSAGYCPFGTPTHICYTSYLYHIFHLISF